MRARFIKAARTKRSREEKQFEALPECRAYEMHTAPDKAGYGPISSISTLRTCRCLQIEMLQTLLFNSGIAVVIYACVHRNPVQHGLADSANSQATAPAVRYETAQEGIFPNLVLTPVLFQRLSPRLYEVLRPSKGAFVRKPDGTLPCCTPTVALSGKDSSGHRTTSTGRYTTELLVDIYWGRSLRRLFSAANQCRVDVDNADDPTGYLW